MMLKRVAAIVYNIQIIHRSVIAACNWPFSDKGRLFSKWQESFTIEIGKILVTGIHNIEYYKCFLYIFSGLILKKWVSIPMLSLLGNMIMTPIVV